MLRLRITFDGGDALRGALAEDIARGMVLVRVAPPEGLGYRDVVALELRSGGGCVAVEAEVMSILPGAGIAVAFPSERAAEVQALADLAPAESTGEVTHEVVVDAPPPVAARAPAAAPAPPGKPTVAERIRLALHGTRDDRAALLRDQDRSLHALVLKSSKVTLDEVATWARNPQMAPEFLKQIGDRKEWLTRSSIAQALVRNPKCPPELMLRALDYVGAEMIKQMAKGIGGVPPSVVAAAKKKSMGK